MHLIDWSIVFFVLLAMIYSVSFSKGLMKSVTDLQLKTRAMSEYDGEALQGKSQGVAGMTGGRKSRKKKRRRKRRTKRKKRRKSRKRKK